MHPPLHRLWSVILLWLVLLPGPASGLSSVISGEFTEIVGTRERLISYRHQERFWIGADGTRYLLVNQGGDVGTGLQLLRRAAQGKQWQQIEGLPGTDRTSTGDGLLVNGNLHLVFSDAAGAIRYARAEYDAASGEWLPPQVAQVYGGGEGKARAPTLAIDAAGRVWCAFTVESTLGRINRIRVFHSLMPLQEWHDSGHSWGAFNRQEAKAARLVITGGSVGLIYTDARANFLGQVVSLRWSRLLDAAAGLWSDELIKRSRLKDKDPYGSHFSALVDDAGNIHLVWPIDGRPRYFRYDAAGERWNYSSWLSPVSLRTAYVQLTRQLDGRLFAIFNVGDQLLVRESRDGGFSFEPLARLIHPTAPFLDWSRPRVEAPSVFGSRLDVLQQVHIGPEEGGVESLYAFELAP